MSGSHLKEDLKDAAGSAVGAAAAGAVQGAAVGGAAGAAAGAVKGVALDLARNKKVRRWATMAVAIVAAISIGSAFLQAALALSVVSALTGGKTENASRAVIESGVDTADARVASHLAEGLGLPWTFVLAATRIQDDIDLPNIASQLDVIDPGRTARDLTAGAVYVDGERHLEIPEDGPGAEEAAAVTAVYTTALTAAGTAEQPAEMIVSQARSWALGEAACTATTAPATPAPGGGIDIGGRSWTTNQVANMRQIIGVATTMFGPAARDASMIGLMTAAVESGFQQYANDGSGGSGADWTKLSQSVNLPHDAVGRDHDSLGTFQQRAMGSWGAYGASTWASDPDAVMKRLMSTPFAAGKFFTVMSQKLPDWQNLAKGAVAQMVQVSAFPDRYAENEVLAGAIYDSLSASSPAIEVPVETGWSGASGGAEPGTGPSAGAGCGAIAPPTGEWVYPIAMNPDGSAAAAITSLYGGRDCSQGGSCDHKGIDIGGLPLNTAVLAVSAGTVTTSLETSNCQGFVIVSHPDGTATGYRHLNSRTVKKGETVTGGQELGKMGGQIGCSRGVHLHLEAFDPSGEWIDPLRYMFERGRTFAEFRWLVEKPGWWTGGASE